MLRKFAFAIGIFCSLWHGGSLSHAAEGLTAADFQALDRLIVQRQGAYARCSDYPCPDVDCAGWSAAVDALSRLNALLGTPLRTSQEQSWGDVEARQRTLGYWTEQEEKAQAKVYDDVLSQALRNRSKQAEIEFWAQWQKSAINLSKLAQAIADFRSLANHLKSPQLDAAPPGLLQEAMAVGEIMNGGANVIELAGAVQDRLKDHGFGQEHGFGPGVAEDVSKAMSYATLAQQGFSAGGTIAQGLEAVNLAKAQHMRFLELSSAPLQQGQLTREAAMAARRAELSALQKSAELNMTRARELARGAASAGLLAAVKLATIYAEGQQKELQDRIAEHTRNASAEEAALAEQAGSIENGASRAAAMLALKGRISGALELLSACQKACPGRLPAAPREVPVKQFVLPQSAGDNAGKESFGAALAWFKDAFRAQAAEVEASSSFRIEDGKITIEGRPASVAVKASITIGFAGAQCLINRGQINGDGETRKLQAGSNTVMFSGKDKPGDYTFQYEMEELWQVPGSERYKADAVVRVGRDKMLGYWRVTSPIMIANFSGNLMELPKFAAFSHIVIVASDAGTHQLWYLRPGGLDAHDSKCQRSGERLACRFTHHPECGDDWLEYEINIADGDHARLRATGGEQTHFGLSCTSIPHHFLPWDFSLAREPVDSAVEKETLLLQILLKDAMI